MIAFLILSIFCAMAGGFLLIDFFLWFFTGTVVPSTIEKFEKGKPVVSFETVDGKKHRALVERITHTGYWLGRPQPGDVFNVITRPGATEGDPLRVRLHGFLHAISGGALLIPLPAWLATEYGRALMASQVAFFAVFAALILGCWALMKILRRNY